MDKRFEEYLSWIREYESRFGKKGSFSHISRNLLQRTVVSKIDKKGICLPKKAIERAYFYLEEYKKMIEFDENYRSGESRFDGFFSEIPKNGEKGIETYIEESKKRIFR